MAEEMRPDWLFPEKEKQQAKQQEASFVFAQKYLVFFGPTADPRARELLEHWTVAARKQRIPAGASAQEYAAANGFREFVEGIHSQIEFAMNGQNVPKPRTT